MTLQDQFGNIDIYLFDQLLRGRIAPGMRVFDAGCGGGRNLVYLLREGYDVCGVDTNRAAVAELQGLAARLAAPGAISDFRAESIEASSFPGAHADVVIANAVLHFARDHAHFEAMLLGMWRVLRPGGILIARLASTIGMAEQMTPLGEGRHRLPHGIEWYLVDAPALLDWTRRLGAQLIDPLKTTVVHEERAMTTWVIRKPK
ncbi:MAG: class I SAM-dependent methyltransferase [Vicinamibacterales bacterium]